MREKLKTYAAKAYGLLGFALLLIGLSGVPSDIAQWRTWLQPMIQAPVLEWLARAGAHFAAVLDHWSVRLTLIVGGLLLLFWHTRWFARDVSASVVLMEKREKPLRRAKDSADYAFFYGNI